MLVSLFDADTILPSIDGKTTDKQPYPPEEREAARARIIAREQAKHSQAAPNEAVNVP